MWTVRSAPLQTIQPRCSRGTSKWTSPRQNGADQCYHFGALREDNSQHYALRAILRLKATPAFRLWRLLGGLKSFTSLDKRLKDEAEYYQRTCR